MKRTMALVAVFLIGITTRSLAYVVPEQDSGIPYFYIFGPQGNPDYGAEKDHDLTFYIDIPQDAPNNMVIGIYDPDTGGRRDFRPKYEEPWDTITEFAVYGANNTLLDRRRFGEDSNYDRKFFEFGPYSPTQGEKVGNNYRFRLDIKAQQGQDANLFKIRVPDNAQIFTYKVTFRMIEKEGAKMYLYPEIPAGTREIILDNYDMDPNGGTGELIDPLLKKQYLIGDSESAQWAETLIPVDIAQTRRLSYVITKKTQYHAHAGLVVKDDKGNDLPIYFQGGVLPQVIPVPAAPTVDCRKFIFDATDSYDPNNQQLSYFWDFGDGTTSTEPVVEHTFAKGGQYTVVLKVKNTSKLECDTATTSEVVNVNSAPQAAFLSPQMSCYNQEIIFDASPTQDNTPGQLTYRWDFGDGTSAQGKTVTKTYERGGLYKVTLTVDDNAKTSCSVASATKEIRINAPPVIGALGDIDLCIPQDQPCKVDFNFVREESPDRGNLKYIWDFGDGTTAQGRKVTHVYARPGDYVAKLTIDDGLGSPCSTGSATVNIRLSKQPVANAGPDITECLGKDILFDGSASRSENKESISYTWNFGDGSPDAQGVKVRHSYKKPGLYIAVLTVRDESAKTCSVSSDTASVSINARTAILLKEVKAVCLGREVDFQAQDLANKRLLRYKWDFGDGTVKEAGPNISHLYKKGGKYLVRVTADDGLATPCSSDTQSIEVRVNSAPIANAGPNLVCCADTESVFDGSGSFDPDGDVLTYTWDFGDGQTGKGVRTTHVYKKTGRYTVTLKVDDNSGTPCSVAFSSFETTVNEHPVSIMKVREGSKR
jgi:PKD repeat protein